MHSSISLAPEPRSAGAARRFVEERIRDRVPADTAEAAVLLTSELVTNVIVHARTPLRLDVDFDDSGICVAVRDDAPQSPTRRGGGETRMTGRGMNLVALLAVTWGVDPTPPGKTVWFRLSA